jgi:hypothetical protein
MLIKSLEKMEIIVENNSSLEWLGWDVIEQTIDPIAFTKLNAAFVNGKWVRTKTYAITNEGWEIPSKYMR